MDGFVLKTHLADDLYDHAILSCEKIKDFASTNCLKHFFLDHNPSRSLLV